MPDRPEYRFEGADLPFEALRFARVSALGRDKTADD